ncbi:MAG: putative DNA binding domain-containing protein [Acidobacteria bacterium]|nr:putative DNA binding domain-containing protein [Acidobacteriota bacterium]
MNKEDLIKKLENHSLPDEHEAVEYKEAKNNYDIDKQGKYFSALSNEANLNGLPSAWLVFGVRDKDKVIIGSQFRQHGNLNSLKTEISACTTNKIGFVDIYEHEIDAKRVVLFEIPAAIRGVPTAWKGHCYARENDGTGALSDEKRDRIRNQGIEFDWSAVICEGATIADLDPDAIALARKNYSLKFPQKQAELESWDDVTFLNKAKITIKGKVTRTAILLLGKAESEYFLNPSEAKIRWILKDSSLAEVDYQIECCPFILAVDVIYNKIRNLRYRYIKEGTLFPDEVDRYEPYTIREALNNCIAHQDYALGGRINVVEEEDRLVFSNLGSFIPGSVERVIQDNAPEEKYRNKFLATAMVNLNMVDTIGSGIKKMFAFQRQRFFPLPEYDLSKNRVKVTIIGKVLDMEYAAILARDQSLSLEDIMMLDKVQKGKSLALEDAKHLRNKGLIEGKRPNYMISVKLARETDQKAEYTKAAGLEKIKYFELITNCIKQHGDVHRQDIDRLLWDVLPAWMTEKQKRNKISNLIQELRRKKAIANTGSDNEPKWILSNK